MLDKKKRDEIVKNITTLFRSNLGSYAERSVSTMLKSLHYTPAG